MNKNIEKALEKANAIWTKEGWVIKENLYLIDMGLTDLPKLKEVGGNFYCHINKL